MCVEAGAAFALSSDAHTPGQIGFGYEQALELMGGLGITEICTFDRRRRQLERVG
jgi:histidinol-phosphatase (PHP family)